MSRPSISATTIDNREAPMICARAPAATVSDASAAAVELRSMRSLKLPMLISSVEKWRRKSG
ncbi:hypothetical protein [Massilia sp. TSP1-1-2]|uniref:hypothetical protein n=1 Tax=unclassified Massilia TaxID=2609279 RepID=UPI003CF625CD